MTIQTDNLSQMSPGGIGDLKRFPKSTRRKDSENSCNISNPGGFPTPTNGPQTPFGPHHGKHASLMTGGIGGVAASQRRLELGKARHSANNSEIVAPILNTNCTP